MQIGDRTKQLVSSLAHHKLLIGFTTFLLVTGGLFIIDRVATNYIDTHYRQLAQSQAQLLGEINRLPAPEDMDIGVINSQARFVISETTTKQESTVELAADMRFSYSHRMAAYFSLAHAPSSLRQKNRHIHELHENIEEKLVPYSAQLEAMQGFIEYNPEIDTTDFSPGSAESNERMERLSRGLETAEENLEATSNTVLKEAANSLIATAKATQRRFQQGNSREEFIESFQELQINFQAAAQREYDEIIPALREKTIQTSRQL